MSSQNCAHVTLLIANRKSRRHPDHTFILVTIMGFSTRISIQWGQSEPSEPTDTLVLTSPGSHYVDVRLLKKDRSPQWVFTGKVIESINDNGEQVQTFTHEVDSTNQEIMDSGVFSLLENGDEKETGRMKNPETGLEDDYIEIWRQLDPSERKALRAPPEPTKDVKSFVLVKMDSQGSVAGKIIRIGNWTQGVAKDQGEIHYVRVFHDSTELSLEIIDKVGHWPRELLELKNAKIGMAIGEWTVIEAS